MENKIALILAAVGFDSAQVIVNEKFAQAAESVPAEKHDELKAIMGWKETSTREQAIADLEAAIAHLTPAKAGKNSTRKTKDVTSADNASVLAALKAAGKDLTMEEIARSSGLALNDCKGAVMRLKMKGEIRQSRIGEKGKSPSRLPGLYALPLPAKGEKNSKAEKSKA